MKSFWDERYSVSEYIYGTEPNNFFKEQIEKLKPGRMLLLGEGEGRNAVFAAKLGWQVDAVDQSRAAKAKALKLAEVNNVHINYIVADIHSYALKLNSYDAAGIIFLHLNEQESMQIHKKLIESLKIGGRIILELFSKNQYCKNSGGPQDLSVLSSVQQIKKNFSSLKHVILEEKNIFLSEGKHHAGEASVIRFIGIK